MPFIGGGEDDDIDIPARRDKRLIKSPNFGQESVKKPLQNANDLRFRQELLLEN